MMVPCYIPLPTVTVSVMRIFPRGVWGGGYLRLV